MNISKHPILKQAYELCLEIEKLPASTEQTNLAVLASKLGDELERFVDGQKVIDEFSTRNTRGEQAAWPCQATDPAQHTDAVGGEGCKATTSEIKP